MAKNSYVDVESFSKQPMIFTFFTSDLHKLQSIQDQLTYVTQNTLYFT